MSEIIITPQFDAIMHALNSKMNILVRIQAPNKPEELPERQPLNLALVIDRSSSMRGEPLYQAKRCAEMIIDSLLPKDSASLIVYGDEAEVLVSNKKLSDAAIFKKAIQGIRAEGMTALFDGWKQGAHSLPKNPNQFSRVLLLSDGQANRGITQIDAIKEKVCAMADKSVSTSTYGLGLHFNEELMLQIAESGGGNAYYGQTAEDLMDPFIEEFELISSLYGKNVKIEIENAEGVELVVKNVYQRENDSIYKLPNMAYDAEIWVFLEANISKEAAPEVEGEQLQLGKINVYYKDMEGVEQRLPGQSLSLPTINPKAFAMLTENELVHARMQEVRAAEIQLQAKKAVDNEDWHELDRLLQYARQNAGQNKWLQDVITSLEELAKQRSHRELSLELIFGARKMRSRLAAKHERMDSTESNSMYLRRKSQQGKND